MLTRRGLLAALLTAPLARPALARTTVGIGDAQLASLLSGRLEPFPGSGVVAGIWEEGTTRQLLAGRGLHGDSVCQIGAVTKTFTATLFAQMLERGEIHIDDPIDRYLPSGTKTPMSGNRKITLGNLATQTSGLPTTIATLDPSGNPYAGFTEERLYDFLGYYQLPFPIGSQYQTSNLGFGLLGFLLARRLGTDYATLLHDRILHPLDMSSTGIVPSESMRSRLATPRTWDGERVRPWDYGVLAGGGGAYSSVSDLLRFLDANATLSGPVGGACKLAQQARVATAMGEVGFAWNTERIDGTLWHNGLTGGSHAFLGISQDRKLGTVLLANAEPIGIDEIGFHLVDPTLEPLKAFPAVVNVSDAVLERYAGTYDILDGTLKIVRVAGGLAAAIDGEHPLRIYPSSQTQFFYKAVDAQIEFVTDRSGRATSLMLSQRGIVYEGTRVGR